MRRLKADGNLAANVGPCWSWPSHVAPISPRRSLDCWLASQLWRISHSSRKLSPALLIVCTCRVQVSVIVPPTRNNWLPDFLDKDIIDVALLGAAPISPAVTVGAEVGASWWTQNGSGLFRDACDPSGSYIYTPLYNLKRLRRPSLLRRDSPQDDDL